MIVGKHGGTYEAYYIQADPQGTGSIGALDGSNFLRKSKLNDTFLSQIWDLSDPMGKGYLEKTGFFVALKLIALVQNSHELSVSKLTTETSAPDLGPVEPVDPSTQSTVSPNVPWDISLSEKSSYDKVFDSLNPINNMLGGDKVKPVLINSKLPVDVLGRIWDLSDIDKDGFLDRDEFAVAMHLVYQAREGHETPAILKPGLIPPSKRKGAGMGATLPMPGAVPVLPMGIGQKGAVPVARPVPGQATGSSPVWVVTALEKANADVIFKKLDTDMDGLVSGAETRDVMAQSGLPNTVLAQIWSLCDIQSQGKLTSDQFALALYLIQQAMKGVDPPAQLTVEMIPPSQRPSADLGAFGVRDGTNSGPYSHCADFSAIKDLDQISKEIDDFKKEKLQLERDKAQQEADIKIRQSEVQVLQKELDSLNVTLTQLDSQKKEAQKRLDELDDKRSNLERNVNEMRDKTETEQMEMFPVEGEELTPVNKMKSLLSNRDQMIKDQENELTSCRKELIELRDEEAKLEQTLDSSRQQLELLGKSRHDISDQIKQTKTKMQNFKDQYQGVENGFGTFNGAGVTTSAVNASSLSTTSNVDGFKDDPFKGQDPFGNSGVGSDSGADPFQNDDPFKDSDPFKSTEPFGSEDPFKDAFGSSTQTKTDPFGNVDPFGGSGSSQSQKASDSFDAFGTSWGLGSNQSSQSSGFASDPFGDSGCKPSLPAKKKAPPPRPAPPKSKSPLPMGSSSSKPKVDPFADFDSDPFSGSGTSKTTSNSDPFANFADFSPGKFDSDNDSSAFGGGPSVIKIKETKSTKPQPAKRHISLSSSKTLEFEDTDA